MYPVESVSLIGVSVKWAFPLGDATCEVRVPVTQLQASNCARVPKMPGVYVVLRDAPGMPTWLPANPGGRLIWQIQASDDLRVAWTTDFEPLAREARLIQAFVDEFGAMPFANLRR